MSPLAIPRRHPVTFHTFIPTTWTDWVVVVGGGAMVWGGAQAADPINALSLGGIILSIAGLLLKALRLWQTDRREQRRDSIERQQLAGRVRLAELEAATARSESTTARRESALATTQLGAAHRRIDELEAAVARNTATLDSGEFPAAQPPPAG